MTADLPHRRLNLLTDEWVLVSPQRMQRPWQGERKTAVEREDIPYDPECYLCPGNKRVGGATNPQYSGLHVFPNDFPALLEETAERRRPGLLREEAARGEARVMCYSPDHSTTLARMDDPSRRRVVDMWCRLSAELGKRWHHVEIFENKGAMMGASSPHPHGQAWASDFVPTIVARENACQLAHEGNLLGDIVAEELAERERVVAENTHWVAVVPHWAAWPFEVLLIARDHVARLEDMGEEQRDGLSVVLGRVLAAYDALFDTDFPYSMGWHGAPHHLGKDCAHWRLHAHFYPPLLRSADIRKHMVGFELLAEIQRDLTPEAAAARLREAMP